MAETDKENVITAISNPQTMDDAVTKKPIEQEETETVPSKPLTEDDQSNEASLDTKQQTGDNPDVANLSEVKEKGDTGDTNTSAKRKASDEKPLPQRPVKRARTAYFIFADEKRPQIQKEHPGEGVATQAKALGELWSSLTEDDKKVYQEKAALEREQVAKKMEEWLAAGGVEPDVTLNKSSSDSLVMPVARIRKICKLDTDVKGLSKEALMLVTKAAELFTAKLGGEAVRVAQIQNRRKLLPDDIAQVCSTRSALRFLQPDIQDLVRQQVEEHQETTANKQNSATSAKAAQDQRGSAKPLTDFFAKK